EGVLSEGYLARLEGDLARVRDIACQVASGELGLVVEWLLSRRGAKALAGIGLAGANSMLSAADWGVVSWMSAKAGLYVAQRESRGLIEYFGRRFGSG